MKTDIVLATLNARYIHAAFGLRYLKANLLDLEPRAQIREFTLEQRPLDIAEQLLSAQPEIIGLGVYIWNADQSFQLVSLLKTLAPQVTLVLGGPEVSYEQDQQPICQLADFVLSGPAEGEFYALCKRLLEPSEPGYAPEKALTLEQIKLPYSLYTDEDLENRVIYVEASRGCPFKCEFCLSALDKTAKPFILDRFLDEMEGLYQRGARHFKFVDRTFNLSTRVSLTILQFFLDKVPSDRSHNDIFLHFEVIPDRLPDALKALIRKFPPGSLQFEVGVQTFNPEVQTIIQRKQDNHKSRQNLDWLCRHSPAHIHADLIFGLPGESLESMADSFNQLVALGPEEIQLGTLKRLRGMPMTERVAEFELVFNPLAPYDILSTREVDFTRMQTLRRMARYWDLVANSGRFRETLGRVLGNAPFDRFMQLSIWLYARTGRTHKISLMRMFDLMFEALTTIFCCNEEDVLDNLRKDYQRSGLKGLPQCLRRVERRPSASPARGRGNKRQRAHIA